LSTSSEVAFQGTAPVREVPGRVAVRSVLVRLHPLRACGLLGTRPARDERRPGVVSRLGGSLLLHRIGLAPTTHCRSPGALRNILYVISPSPTPPPSLAGFVSERRWSIGMASDLRVSVNTGIGRDSLAGKSEGPWTQSEPVWEAECQQRLWTRSTFRSPRERK
jgi:hypothetical protein